MRPDQLFIWGVGMYVGLAAVVLSRYDLTRARQQAIRAQLESRAGAAALAGCPAALSPGVP